MAARSEASLSSWSQSSPRGWSCGDESSFVSWGRDVPKGWGRAKEKPKAPEAAAAGESSSSRRGDCGGGSGGEEVQPQEVRKNAVPPQEARRATPEEPQPRVSPIPAAKPPAGGEGGPGGAVRGDIPHMVESALDRRLAKHEQALRALFQEMLDEQQAKFDSSLGRLGERLHGHEAQVDKLQHEVTNSTGDLANQLKATRQALAVRVDESAGAIIESLREQLATHNIQRRNSEDRRDAELVQRLAELPQRDTPAKTPRETPWDFDEETPHRGVEQGGSASNSSEWLGRGTSAVSRAVLSSWTPTVRACCPSLPFLCECARRARRRARRSYSDALRGYRDRGNRDSLLDYAVDSRAFELAMILVVCVHIAVLVWQTNSFAKNPKAGWAPAKLPIEVGFLVVYTIEIALKLKSQRLHFVFGPERVANVFDCALLVVGAVDLIVEHHVPPGSSAWRVLRLFRLLRVARVYRLFGVTHSMQVILRCLLSCWSSIFGSIIIVLAYLLCFALFLVPSVADHIREGGVGVDQLKFYREHFGSVSRCMLTLYASVISGEGWARFHGALEEISVAPAAAAFVVFSFFYMVVVVNIVLGIFVQKVLIHTHDATQNAKHKTARADLADAAWMLDHCQGLIGKGSSLSYKDFLGLMWSPEFREKFKTRTVQLHDAEALFRAFAQVPRGEEDKHWKLHCVDRRLFFEACMRLKREVTTTEFTKSRVTLHDHQQENFSRVLSELDQIQKTLGEVSQDSKDLRKDFKPQAKKPTSPRVDV